MVHLREVLSSELPVRLCARQSGVPSCREIRKREEMKPINIKSDRVLRGGSWNDDARDCRAGLRLNFAPDFRNYGLGFRLSMRFVRGKKK